MQQEQSAQPETIPVTNWGMHVGVSLGFCGAVFAVVGYSVTAQELAASAMWSSAFLFAMSFGLSYGAVFAGRRFLIASEVSGSNHDNLLMYHLFCVVGIALYGCVGFLFASTPVVGWLAFIPAVAYVWVNWGVYLIRLFKNKFGQVDDHELSKNTVTEYVQRGNVVTMDVAEKK